MIEPVQRGFAGRHLVRECTFLLTEIRLEIPELTSAAKLWMVVATGFLRLRCCNPTTQPTGEGPDISLLRLELQRHWDHAKNQYLGDRQITVPGVCGGIVTTAHVDYRMNGWQL